MEVVKIFHEQRPEIQLIVKAVLDIERSRLHLRRTPKATIEKLVAAVREIVE